MYLIAPRSDRIALDVQGWKDKACFPGIIWQTQTPYIVNT